MDFDGVLNTFWIISSKRGTAQRFWFAASDATKAIEIPGDQAFKDITAKLKDHTFQRGWLRLIWRTTIFGTVADGLEIVDNGLSTADTILQKDQKWAAGRFH